MNKKVKTALYISGAAILGAAAVAGVSYGLTKALVKLAIDREQPLNVTDKNKTKLMGAKPDEGFIKYITQGAKALRDMPHKVLEIYSHDGIRLIGHYFEAPNPKRTLVCMHGWRSDWANDFGRIAPFFLEQGCNLLLAEQRAQGKSGGKYLGFGLLERYDCLDWINHIIKLDPKASVYLAGVSMGATTVLMTAGFELPKNVKGIIADCGFTSPEDIWRFVIKNNIRLSYHGLRRAAVDDLCQSRLNMAPDGYSTETALREAKVPVLFIHGANDSFVPVEMTYRNYLACASPKKLLIIPGADHGMSYYTDKALYENEVKEFFNKGE